MNTLAGLSEESRDLALERYWLLQSHLEESRPLRPIAAAAGVSLRTAQRWVAQYQRFGLAALARKRRADRGERRAVSARMREAIEGLALQKPPVPIAALYRQVRQLAQQLGEEPPGYWVVYRIVRSLPDDLVTLAHQGVKAYGEAFELVHRREANRPNAIWQADHTLLDILLIGPDGKVAKPWLTTVIDDYSRAVAGYFLSFDAPSVLHTSLALRQAIWRKQEARWIVCGIPDVLYTDNGSDFASRHLEQVGADLRIRLVFSTPGKPRGRGRIERFFSTASKMFLCDLEGYAPVGRVVRGKPKLTLAELDTRFRAFLLDVYHRRKNGETKMAPVERWGAKGFLARMPDSLEQLDLLLVQVAKARRVRTDGIRFQNLRYVSATLAAYVGETVTVRFDPRDMAEIRVFHEDRFLCRAICPDLAGATVPLREILRARNRRRRQLRGFLRDRQSAVDSLLAIKRGEASEKKDAPSTDKVGAKPSPPPLKRYQNE